MDVQDIQFVIVHGREIWEEDLYIPLVLVSVSYREIRWKTLFTWEETGKLLFTWYELRIISAHAFLYNTSLKTINLGTCHVESININAFGDIAAESLLLPRTLTGQSQFPIVSDCKVTTFEVDDDNPYFCYADGVIFSKDMTVLLQYPPGKSGRYSVPDTVKEIGAEAFAYSQIEEVYIPDSVTEIGMKI